MSSKKPSKKKILTSPNQKPPQEAYVWIWLPSESSPVVAGKLEHQESVITFIYGQSYLERKNAISIFDQELPLRTDIILPLTGLSIAGCIRDAAPDAWGRRVILNRIFGRKIHSDKNDPLNELSYLLESGSDRIGALDFQASPIEYVPREYKNASLEELLSSAERVENGILLTPELDTALHHGTSIGGARPKALIDDGSRKYIAKFSSTSDSYNVVKAEFIAMRLASLAGLSVAPVELQRISGKDVLLIERFDRIKLKKGYARRSLISALTLLSLDEMMARYASYQDLCEIIRTRFDQPKSDLRELFKRLIFNVLISNNDDHARNHAALWDGKNLSLSPAYDLCPQKRGGRESNQAMLIRDDDKKSRLETCFDSAHQFLLSRKDAITCAKELMESIIKNWSSVCEEAQISEIDQRMIKATQFFNLYAFHELKTDAAGLLKLRVKFLKT